MNDWLDKFSQYSQIYEACVQGNIEDFNKAAEENYFIFTQTLVILFIEKLKTILKEKDMENQYLAKEVEILNQEAERDREALI